MTINIIISIQNGVRIRTQPENVQERAIEIGSESVVIGSTETHTLYSVITQTVDDTKPAADISDLSLDWIIMHVQSSQKELVVDENGDPILLEGEEQYAVNVYQSSAKEDYVPFMADVPDTYNPDGTVATYRSPTVDDVIIGTFMGHEAFVL